MRRLAIASLLLLVGCDLPTSSTYVLYESSGKPVASKPTPVMTPNYPPGHYRVTVGREAHDVYAALLVTEDCAWSVVSGKGTLLDCGWPIIVEAL